jgi:hypothetical protein
MKKHTRGFIVIFCLMMISVIVMLTEQLLRSVMVGSQFIKTMVAREHAEILALSGINIAIAQLSFDEHDKNAKTQEDKKDEKKTPESPDGKETEEQGDGKKDPLKTFVSFLLPRLNRWQTVTLDQKIDGLEGQMKICIVCEQGKINLNEVFDFKKQEFKKEYEMLLKSLEIPGRLAAGEMHTKLLEYLKKCKRPITDVSELMNVQALDGLSVFYEPPELRGKEHKSVSSLGLALQDIFTIWSGTDTIDPIVFSSALCNMFGLRPPAADDTEKLKERFKQVVSAFKKDWGENWEENWKHLQIIYDQKPKILPAIKDILAKKFSPKVFSVLSYGKVDQVEQRVLAIVKKIDAQQEWETVNKNNKQESDKNTQDQKDKDKKDSKEKKKKFKIVRLYWL